MRWMNHRYIHKKKEEEEEGEEEEKISIARAELEHQVQTFGARTKKI